MPPTNSPRFSNDSPIARASALTQSDDSRIRADVRVCGHGSNRLCPSFRRRSSASAGHRGGSQSSAQTCAAGAHPPLFGRPFARAGGGAARERQPTRGLALASAIRRASNGSPIIRAGHSISPRPRPRGSTPSRASSRPSHAARSDAEPSIPSTICRTRSHATSTPATAIVGPSHGPLPPKRSSQNSLRSLYLLSESVQ
jgi:hypothetical protein